MLERAFNEHADAMLARIEQSLEGCAADIDYEIMPGGIIEIEFPGAGGGKIIINRHTAAREIWIAAKSGGYHFKMDAADPGIWIDTRDGVDLMARLSRCITEQSGLKICLA